MAEPSYILLYIHSERDLPTRAHAGFLGAEVRDGDETQSCKKSPPVVCLDLSAAAPSWLLRPPDAVSRAPSPVRDPFEAAGLWSPSSFAQHTPQPAVAEEVWPRGQTTQALRWSQQATQSFLRSFTDGCVIQDDPPFREGIHSNGFTPTFDSEGKRVIWPWEADRTARSPTPNVAQASQQTRFVELPKLAPHRTDALIQRAMDASTASGSMGRNTTGVRHWHTFCHAEGVTPDRALDPNSSLAAKLLEEQLCMRFCAALIQDQGVQPSTVQTYFGQLQGWHLKAHGVKLCAGLKLGRLPAMVKGLKRIYGEQPREVRRGIAPQALRKAFNKVLDPANPAHANIRAALSLALQGLLRGAEFTLEEGQSVDYMKLLTRADVRVCTGEQLVVMMRPCKNMRHLNGKTVPLAVGAGGNFIDAVWEMNNLLRVDPIPASRRATTPLFRDPATNDALRSGAMRRLTRMLMASIGEAPSQFGLHSYRIGGATALFAAGATPLTIRMMGRWSSDCYRLYVRACYEQTLEWTAKCGSTKVHDLAGEFGKEVDFY